MQSKVIIPAVLILLSLVLMLITSYLIASKAIQHEKKTSQLQLELALAKTENRALAQKLAACQNPPVEREPKPILNF